ncbi:hypothetical protein IAQ61_006412 [Plenodomus lingam]|uniref:uncharacterized protein n=1 Tax=Leptosphaeria maculans TaxID=5022 RepID=UPI003319A033|nr:hypothetical protein IAQ61_006412 [Plenodomus lingam]
MPPSRKERDERKKEGQAAFGGGPEGQSVTNDSTGGSRAKQIVGVANEAESASLRYRTAPHRTEPKIWLKKRPRSRNAPW